MADGRVVIDITGDDSGFRRAVEGLGKAAAAGMGALSAATGALGAAALRASTDFNRGMADVASLIPGNTARVEELKRAVQGMAVETGKSTAELTPALYQTLSAFGDTAETALLLEKNVRIAAAGAATAAEAIALTSAVTKAYGDTSAEAVGRVGDLATLAVRLGQTTFPELASAVGGITPLYNELGVSQEELFAGMSTLAGVTGTTAEVSTQLKGVMQALLAPTDAAAAAIEAAGYADARALIAKEGLAGAIGVLTGAAEESGRPLADYIGSIEGQIAALALAGPQAETYAGNIEAMAAGAGAGAAALREQTSGVNELGHMFDQARQLGTVALQRLGDAIGAAIGPEVASSLAQARELFDTFFARLDAGLTPAQALGSALREVFGPEAGAAFDTARAAVDGLAGALEGAAAWAEDNRAWLEPVAVAIASMAAAWKVYTAAVALAAAAKKGYIAVQVALNAAIATNTNGLIVLAVVGLVAAIVHLWRTNERFREIVTGAWNAVRSAVLGVVNWFRTAVPAAFEAVASFLSRWGGTVLKVLGGPIAAGVALWNRFGGDIVAGLRRGIEGAWRALVDRFRGLVGMLPAAVKRILGISSPSRVFRALGSDAMAGLAAGLEAGWGPVRELMGGYSAALASIGAVPAGAGVPSGMTLAPLGTLPAAAAAGAVTHNHYHIGDVSIPASDPGARRTLDDLARLVRRYQRMGPMEGG